MSNSSRPAAWRLIDFRPESSELNRRRPTIDGQDVRRTRKKNQSVPGTDRSSNNPACPIHLVYRRAAGDGRAGQPIPAEQTNPCQALIADRSAASRLAGDRSSRLYDGHLVRRDPIESVVSQPAIGRVTFGELRSPRVPAPASTDKMSVVQPISARHRSFHQQPCLPNPPRLPPSRRRRPGRLANGCRASQSVPGTDRSSFTANTVQLATNLFGSNQFEPPRRTRRSRRKNPTISLIA